MKHLQEIRVETNSLIVNSLSPQHSEKTARSILFIPSWLFFVENIPVEPASTSAQRREQAALHLESFAPVPAEQLLSGFASRPRGDSVLCYAAARERCRSHLEKLPAKTLHCLPPFALWDNAAIATPRWEWLATENELTAILIDPDNTLPVRVRSWELHADAGSKEAFSTRILAEYDLRKKEIEKISSAEHKEGIYLPGEQFIDKKNTGGEIRLNRLNADGSAVPAARVLRFSLTDDSLWNADIRDTATLSRERKERKNAVLCKRALSLCGIIAVFLAIAQILLWIFTYKTGLLVDEETRQRPLVTDIRNQVKLIADISKVQENKLQTIRTVAVLNARRPNGVGFSNFSGNGTSGTISVTGTAENITLAKEFEKNIRECGFFTNVVFTANIASAGANFSLQCQPDKNAIDEIDFYDTPEKDADANAGESAAEGDDDTVPAEIRDSEPEREGDSA